MAKSWNKSHPCPVCGGFGGAYKKENRCRGFKGEGDSAWCEIPNDGPRVSPLGFNLYLYHS